MTPLTEQYVLMGAQALLILNLGGFVSWWLCVLALIFAFALAASHTPWQLYLSAGGFLLAQLISAWIGAPIVLLGAVLQFVLPIPRIRRETVIKIGRRSHLLESATRDNSAYHDGRDHRKRQVPISILYPCEASTPATAERHVLFDNFSQVGQALCDVLPAIPDQLRPVMRLVLSHVQGPSSAFKEARGDGTDRKVVILLHGITGPRWQVIVCLFGVALYGCIKGRVIIIWPPLRGYAAFSSLKLSSHCF